MSRKGFSLLELLMASVVVATAGVLLFTSLAQITRSRALAREQTIMRTLLANRLALLETVTEGEQAGGSCEAPYDTYRWAVSSLAALGIPREGSRGKPEGAAGHAPPAVAQVTMSITSPTGYTMDAQTMRPIQHE